MARTGSGKTVLLHLFLIFLTAFTLLSCGGGGGGGEESTDFSSLTTAITLEAVPDAIVANPGTSCEIRATMTTSSGTPVPNGTYVSFTTTLGTFGNGTTQIQGRTTDDSGVATVSLIAGSVAGTALVTAKSNNVTQQVTVTFTATTPIPASLTLALSKTTVLTSRSDSTTVTATVKDQYNAVIPGATVTFSASGGQLSASSANTASDVKAESGQASVVFSAGDDRANQLVTITAKAGTLTTEVHVQTKGTEVTLSQSTTNLKIGSDPVALTVSVKDADATPVTGKAVTLTASPSGRVVLSSSSGTTDMNGTFEVQVIPLSAGAVTISAESMGARASREFRVSNPSQDFGILSPTDNPTGLLTGTNLVILVNAPTQANVQFATTFGTFTGSTASGQVITEHVSGGRASVSFRATEAGVATILVSDAADASVSDSVLVVVSAAAGTAARISLQTNSRVIQPSTGGVTNSALLKATVWNISGQVIPNVPVLLTLSNTTGGGEYVSPVIAYTDSTGIATATFTAGSVSSGNAGVKVTASVLGMSSVASSEVDIIIGGTAGSIIVSRGSKIETVTDPGQDTYYKLPMAVLVTDASGKALAGVTVTLSTWPNRWATGYWYEYEENKCMPVQTCILYNEDTNRNGQNDSGEDANGDGVLTPPATASGSVPGTVYTGDDGTAVFDLTYVKTSAAWIEAEITASAVVFGTETRSTYTFWLPYLDDEQCELPNSPYREKSITLTASPDLLPADGESRSTLTAVVQNAKGDPVEDGQVVLFSVASGRGSVFPTSATTRGGVATTTYTASRSIGTETVAATVPDSTCTYATADIYLTSLSRPAADFAYEEVGDNERLFFTDASTTPEGTVIVSWYWTFTGCSPATSTSQDPGLVRFLSGPGKYVVTLTVTNDLGYTDTAMKLVEVPFTNTIPTADFTYEDLGDGDRVVFNDASSAVSGTWLVSWHWTFESGSPSTSDYQFPGMVSFGAPGTYMVTLTVTNNLGESHTVGKAVKTSKDEIVYYNMSADFEATDLGDGDRVHFMDTSFIDEPHVLISWYWTFENGTPSTSTLQHPGTVHFGAPGIYLVTLTVTADTGLVRSIAKSIMVTTESPLPDTDPTADFAWTDMKDREHILFADASKAASGTTIASWNWTFTGGNPATSTVQNPGSVSFATGPGWYVTRLTVTNNFGESDEVLKAVEVGTEDASDPTADFTWVGTATNEITFTNTSTAAAGTTIVKQEWNFGDGSTAEYPGTTINLVHSTYPAPGEYLVTLKVTNNVGGTHSRGKIVNVP
jgi:PKD repeat protein